MAVEAISTLTHLPGLTHGRLPYSRPAPGSRRSTHCADAADGAAFVATRPPGHHALGDRAMGFCLLNNVAVSAAALVADGERVLIVDWDVHHGNGTQALFWDNPSVLYVSTHQSPFYPGTGGAAEVGGDEARGLTVNVPLPAGATGDVVRRALDEVAAPVIEEFGPTWVLISAGFDAHRADPLADLALSSGDYADLARTVAGYAPGPGRVVAYLEGGYDLGALRSSVAATLGALADAPEPVDREQPTAGGPGVELVDRAAVRAPSAPWVADSTPDRRTRVTTCRRRCRSVGLPAPPCRRAGSSPPGWVDPSGSPDG